MLISMSIGMKKAKNSDAQTDSAKRNFGKDLQECRLMYGQQHVMIYLHLRFDTSSYALETRAVQVPNCII
jgi:hypothetical protein